MTFDTSLEVRVGVQWVKCIFVANHCCAFFADTRKHPLFISSLLFQLASFAILAQELSSEPSKALLHTKILVAP